MATNQGLEVNVTDSSEWTFIDFTDTRLLLACFVSRALVALAVDVVKRNSFAPAGPPFLQVYKWSSECGYSWVLAKWQR